MPSRDAVNVYADVPSRAAALVIDAVLLTGVIMLAAALIAVVLGPAVEFNPDAESIADAVVVDRAIATVDAIASVLLSAAYFVGSWRTMDASPGMRLCGMRLSDVASGRRLTLSRAVLRWLPLGAPLGLSGLVRASGAPGALALAVHVGAVLWYLALAVTTARHDRKQGWHDRWAHSAVTKAARKAEPRAA